MTREEGKIVGEARGEVQKSINLLEYYAGQSFRIEGRTYPSEMPNTPTGWSVCPRTHDRHRRRSHMAWASA